jgi:hypothetical protein
MNKLYYLLNELPCGSHGLIKIKDLRKDIVIRSSSVIAPQSIQSPY